MKLTLKPKNNKERLFISMSFLILLHFVILSSLWAIDIGASRMMFESSGTEAVAQGLLFIRSPNTQYHLGLGLAYLSFLVLSFWMIYKLVEGVREEKNYKNN